MSFLPSATSRSPPLTTSPRAMAEGLMGPWRRAHGGDGGPRGRRPTALAARRETHRSSPGPTPWQVGELLPLASGYPVLRFREPRISCRLPASARIARPPTPMPISGGPCSRRLADDAVPAFPCAQIKQ
ncbi:hypothetical protein GUJ93_ZPchr0006g40757 [Zizania palustris]|uniref:Uncharacterized protein n=1 Tax=Zizania palustris TaxID=103762 RepID=A0A8J5T9A9_ZIZPA|nr:hypothetical protein GUJ93_ZPchr0006g40757 [Zizania palustris]